MKSWVVTALLGAALAAVSFSGVSAAERTVKVGNGSSSVIVELYVSPPDLGDYGENILGSALRIQPGGSTRVTFEDGGACAFDFQAVTGDEDMFTARNVDVCANAEFKLPQ
jgi:hypothetical protein